MAECQICGSALSGRQQKFCSFDCRQESYNRAYQANKLPAEVHHCRNCDKPLAGRQTVWCSLACKSKFETEQVLINDLATLTRKCNKCGLVKVLEIDFYKTPTGYRRSCRNCVMQGNAERGEKPDKIIVKRNYHLVSTYGITHQEYEDLLRSQNGVCAICGKPPIRKRLAVDHDHVNGLVRGLLCNYCNLRIVGKVRDSSLYRKAADYLDSPPGQAVLPGREVPLGKKKPRRRRSKRV